MSAEIKELHPAGPRRRLPSFVSICVTAVSEARLRVLAESHKMEVWQVVNLILDGRFQDELGIKPR